MLFTLPEQSRHILEFIVALSVGRKTSLHSDILCPRKIIISTRQGQALFAGN
jgi:hypothetical protein